MKPAIFRRLLLGCLAACALLPLIGCGGRDDEKSKSSGGDTYYEGKDFHPKGKGGSKETGN